MKRLLQFGLLGAMASVLAGCPLWDDNDRGHGTGCFGDDCFNNNPECSSSADCGLNETCGEDFECHPGDCTFWGCASGECVTDENGIATCEGGSSGSGGNGASGSGGNGTGGHGGDSGVVYCGNPNDCAVGETCGADGTCQPGDCNAVPCIYGYTCDAEVGSCKPTDPSTCGSNADCAGAGTGYACVSGHCTAPTDQCFDQGQCADGFSCAGGKCIADCNDDGDCGGGYLCNTDLGICNTPETTCQITNNCGGPDAVCVDGACVPRADLGDGSCDEAGTVWSLNGCIPGQTPSFTCVTDGVQDACAAGSICLHRSCYINCAAPNENVCTNLPPSINVCKGVSTVSGAHNVCASNESFGGECDPQASLSCSTGICLDGYCK